MDWDEDVVTLADPSVVAAAAATEAVGRQKIGGEATTTLPQLPLQQDDPASAYVHVVLKNVIPCNLRTPGSGGFIRSRVALYFEREAMNTLLRCYGFMLYNREEKVRTLASSSDIRVRRVASLLGELQDVESYRAMLHQHLTQTRRLLSDEVATVLRLDDPDTLVDTAGNMRSGANPGNEGEAADADGNKLPSARELLLLARTSLEYVLNFVRDSDQVRMAMNVNDYCRQLFTRDASNALWNVQLAWHDAADSDFDTCVSILFRDMIVSTGMETHNSLIFMLRVSMLFTFMITQTMCCSNVTVVDAVTVTVTHDDEDPGTSNNVLADYFKSHNDITLEKVISTMCVATLRMFFVNMLEWPCRLLENNNQTIDLSSIHATFTRYVRNSGGKSLGWLRAFVPRRHRRRNDARQNATMPADSSTPAEQTEESAVKHHPVVDGDALRLYANYDALIGLFGQLAQRIDACDVESMNKDGGVMLAEMTPLPIRNAPRELQRQHAEYEDTITHCAKSIAENLRTGEHGLTPHDYALASSQYKRACQPPSSSSTHTPTEATDAAPTVAHDESAVFVDDPQADAERFAGEVGRALAYSVIALIRHDVAPFADRFDSIHYDNDAQPAAARRGLLVFNQQQDSYGILFQHVYSNLYRAKISVTQAQQFLNQMVTLWNDRIGLVTFEQLCCVLLAIYRMFPSTSATPAV